MHNGRNMIEIHLRLQPEPRQRPAVVEALRALASAALQQNGCTEARVLVEANDPDQLWYFEGWSNEATLKRVLRSIHFTHLANVMEMASRRPALEFRVITETRGLEFAERVRQTKTDRDDQEEESSL